MKDANNKNKSLKAKIYYMALKKIYYNVFFLASLLKISRRKDTNDVTVMLEYTKDVIELVCTDSNKRYYYSSMVN